MVAEKALSKTAAARVAVGGYAAGNVGVYDELIAANGKARGHVPAAVRLLFGRGERELAAWQKETDALVKALGITFSVGQGALDRPWQLDMMPRIMDGESWAKIEAGLRQRLRGLNAFLHDIYNGARILKDKLVPEELVLRSPHYRPQCVGVKPKFAAWAHICGSDLVRDGDGGMRVLEDNLRVPSGVSYMLENREVISRILPAAFVSPTLRVRPVYQYPQQLYRMLASLSPRQEVQPLVVLLTPGVYNSAYFEHLLLAREMGVPLVEAADMVAIGGIVYLRTIGGLRRVDVIYRRTDDWYLDADEMNPDSAIGVRGLMAAWRKGNIAIANAPGCGVADDKAVYSYVPKMIEYYLTEKPILENVPTLWLGDAKLMAKVCARLQDYVVKPANEAGGYGVVIGRQTTAAQRSQLAAKIKARPRSFVAQPLVKLSTVPTIINGKLEPRYVDLRPFTLQSDKLSCTAGGLTRVAKRRGSYIVNSSQGGGSKDTWIVERRR